MSAANVANKMEEVIRSRITAFSQAASGTIGDMLQFCLVSYDEEENVCTMTCKTEPWMRNIAGTLHGGMCATILDQAMGFVAYCVKQGEGIAPTISMSVDYHRPLIPGESVLVKVRVISVTHSFLSLSAEAMGEKRPEKVCVSGSGIYYCTSRES